MEHLRFSTYYISTHAQTAMKELGITYRFAIPQSIADQWWFLDCKNVPKELPKHITPMDIGDPMSCVGYGLSKEMAQELINAMENEAIINPS